MNYIQIQVDDALREMNEGAITDDERLNHYHNTIYTNIFDDQQLFVTHNFDFFFVNFPKFNFYNNLLVYLTKYLTEFTPDKQRMYLKYMCKEIFGALSQYAKKGNREPKRSNLIDYGKVVNGYCVVGVKDKFKLDADFDDLNCFYFPEETPHIDIGGNSKKRKTKNRKTKKRKSKKRKSKRPKSTRKRV